MKIVRLILACAWLLLIFSLFYDPISPWLTDPNTAWSPLKINPQTCILVQGVCLHQEAYPLGNSIFWGIVVPMGVLVLLVFGHEFWRRICPLSFFSQIPRGFGKQRQLKRIDAQTAQVRYELPKIKTNSWLGRNYSYLQFFLLYIGVCTRILFFDSNRLVLGIFLLFTIASAIIVGYLYAGKSWCQYFCPMAPVQVFYGEPRGLLASVAHEGDRALITQSMCRRVTPEGKEESACVACNSPCIDIDAERAYWDKLNQPNRKFIYYSYTGLVIGFFSYYYLYSGSWMYLLSGAWSRPGNPMANPLSPGFYLFNNPIPIPRLVAVPLTIGLCSFLTYWLGMQLEKYYKTYQLERNSTLTPQYIQHQIFTICTFLVFNFFFIFAGRSYISKLPLQLPDLFNILLVVVSTLWLYRTWGRSQEIYSRESLASRLRKQLKKLQLDVSRFLEGRSLDTLNSDEVYVLAKILPGFTGDKRIEAYKGVLREALEEGYVNSTSSLEVLQQMRQELGISEQEHLTVLTELGVEDPDLFDPNQQRTKENQIRLQSFRQNIRALVTSKRRRGAKGLGRELLKVVKKEKSISEVLQKDDNIVRTLSREYGISLEEEAQILADLDEEGKVLRRANILLNQLQELRERYQALQSQKLIMLELFKGTSIQKLIAALNLLQATLEQKQRVFVKGVLEILESLEEGVEATRIALALGSLAANILPDILQNKTAEWDKRINPLLLSRLKQQMKLVERHYTEVPHGVRVGYLEAFLAEPDSLTKAVSLYILHDCDRNRGQQQARQLLESHLMLNPLVKETAQRIIQEETLDKEEINLSILEKLLCFSASSLLNNLKTDQLIDLAYQVKIKTYQASEIILEQGDFSRDLLLLIDGNIKQQIQQDNGKIIEKYLSPIQLLNQLEILAHTEMSATLTAIDSEAKVLVIDGLIFDSLLSQDKDFARKIIEQESRRLQTLGMT